MAVFALSAGLAGLATYALRDKAVTPAHAAIGERTSAMPAFQTDGFATARLVAPQSDLAYLLGPVPTALSGARFAGVERAPEPTAPITMASLPDPALVELPVTPSILPAPLPLSRPAEPSADGPDTTMVAPLPLRRPADAPAASGPTTPERPRIASRRNGRDTAAAATPAAQPDGRTFFERLFAARTEPSGPQLAYAPSGSGASDASTGSGAGSFGARLGLSFPGLVAPKPPTGVAIYDIGSRMVYLPNGEQLEAQSGLGEMRNDVRYAHVRMRGPTPPHTYDLVEREALFHGVRAIRLNPVGGSQAIHGRAGLLAHTYLLGPSGDSNGCISIKDYNRFLQAYLRGEIRQLIVVRDRNEAVAAVARATTRMAQR
ncbi:tlde1 domain-containing protein [Phreatobacter sp. HK31-P]